MVICEKLDDELCLGNCTLHDCLFEVIYIWSTHNFMTLFYFFNRSTFVNDVSKKVVFKNCISI